jgi:hypothetical protein
MHQLELLFIFAQVHYLVSSRFDAAELRTKLQALNAVNVQAFVKAATSSR